MKAKVTITLVIDNLKEYIDDSEDLSNDDICQAFESEVDEGDVSIDDLMMQDDVDFTVQVTEYTE